MKWQTDLIEPEDVERVKDAFRLALKTNKSYTREYRIQAASGAIRWIQERGQIVCGDDGRVDFGTGICTDITMQREMYATLQENERNFRLLINTLPSIVFKGYSDFSVEFFDDKIPEKLLGYPAMDFNTRQRKWQEIIFPDDLDRAKEIMKQALKGDKSYVREYRIQAKSGEILWVRERAQIVVDGDGKIGYITGTFSVITAEHAMQETLESMQKHHEM